MLLLRFRGCSQLRGGLRQATSEHKFRQFDPTTHRSLGDGRAARRSDQVSRLTFGLMDVEWSSVVICLVHVQIAVVMLVFGDAQVPHTRDRNRGALQGAEYM